MGQAQGDERIQRACCWTYPAIPDCDRIQGRSTHEHFYVLPRQRTEECTFIRIRVVFFTEIPLADIIDTAVSAGTFKTLAAAVGAAGLVETLKGAGPFTVFAPNDAAFAKLPAGTVESLVKPENKSKLAGILTYHVVAGKVMAADVMKISSAKTVNGQSVKVTIVDGKVKLDGATVIATDIVCDNGVIHVIDSVILPS